jgi:uncharacterized protein YdaT
MMAEPETLPHLRSMLSLRRKELEMTEALIAEGGTVRRQIIRAAKAARIKARIAKLEGEIRELTEGAA